MNQFGKYPQFPSSYCCTLLTNLSSVPHGRGPLSLRCAERSQRRRTRDSANRRSVQCRSQLTPRGGRRDFPPRWHCRAPLTAQPRSPSVHAHTHGRAGQRDTTRCKSVWSSRTWKWTETLAPFYGPLDGHQGGVQLLSEQV